MDSRTDFDAALAAEPPIPDPNAASPGPRTVEPAADEDPAAGSPFIAQWLSALFAHVDGDVTAIADGKRIVVSSAADIVSLARGDVRVDLETSDGFAGFAGFAMGFDSAANAQAAWGKTLEPSRVVKTPDGSIVAIYLTDAPAAVVHQILEEWQPADDEPSSFLGTGTVVPLPVGAYSTTTADEEDVAEGNTTVYSEAEIRAAFLPDDEDQLPILTYDNWREGVRYGPDAFPDGFFERPITVAWARHSRQKTWKNTTSTMGALVDMMLNHAEGEKEGPCFTQGELVRSTRTKDEMKTMHVFGLDFDNGTSRAYIKSEILRSGHAAVIYSTHSHLKNTTDIGESAYAAWCRQKGILYGPADAPDTERLKEYLTEQKRFLPSVVANLSWLTTEQKSGGMQITVQHAPIEKFRVIFLLESPVMLAEWAKTRQLLLKDAHAAWERKVYGIAQFYRVEVDEACTDSSRLWFGPRYPKGGRSLLN